MKLRAKSTIQANDEPSENPASRIRQLQVIAAAYQSLTVAEPILPSAGSPLPALLALRHTEHLINETKTSLLETKDQIQNAKAELNREKGDLRDSQLLAEALELRISNLRQKQVSNSEMTSNELAQSIIAHHKAQKRHYEIELKKLVKAYNKFVVEHLALMLAAEDLGGPRVGDSTEIDEEMLAAGFDEEGMPRKSKAANANSMSKRQERINEIWGPSEDYEDSIAYKTEKEAAGATFRSLTEDLLNASADDTVSDPYVVIPKETAAVRFLVRSKIARFHPQDDKRLRLVDFE